MKTAIVTGGSGYVGTHLIRLLAERERYDRIVNVDLEPPRRQSWPGPAEVVTLRRDLREAQDPAEFRELGCGEDTHIYNLAAICRIPGYPEIDYFRTNIRGAETTCALADALDCRTMVFTSSVSPYGLSEERKTEESVPTPQDPYGSSKLAAEYIHRGWQQAGAGRHLAILRPGIIFGPMEQANFTRLYESLKGGWFVYPGRSDTRKACIYVKDVARACEWFAHRQEGLELFNLVYERAPTLREICEALHRLTDAGRPRLTVPGPLLTAAAGAVFGLGRLTGRSFSGIRPERVRKVMKSTDISGEKLARSGFELRWSLEEGIADWFEVCEGTLC